MYTAVGKRICLSTHASVLVPTHCIEGRRGRKREKRERQRERQRQRESSVALVTDKLFLPCRGSQCSHHSVLLCAACEAVCNVWPVIRCLMHRRVLVREQDEVGKGAFQELDQVSAAHQFCKFSQRATKAADVPLLISRAVQVHKGGLMTHIFCIDQRLAAPSVCIHCAQFLSYN